MAWYGIVGIVILVLFCILGIIFTILECKHGLFAETEARAKRRVAKVIKNIPM